MYAILGLAMFYTWGHTAYLLIKENKNRTQYEKVVVWFAIVSAILFIIGTLE